MASGPGQYQVSKVPRVATQIRALADKASQAGSLKQLKEALQFAADQLHNSPRDWGDPLRDTKKKDGVVCRGIRSPVIVHYAVYDDERVVIVLDVLPYPGKGLD